MIKIGFTQLALIAPPFYIIRDEINSRILYNSSGYIVYPGYKEERFLIDILIVGSGGREHALGWKLRQSPEARHLIFAPGNGGTARLANSENVAVGIEDIEGLIKLAQEKKPGLIVVGPEAPLAAGLADRLRAEGFDVFGPGAQGAQIEASKAWAKSFMSWYGIPTAARHTFDNLNDAINYLYSEPGPYVLKADGLAAGKGVLVTEDRNEAIQFATQVMLERIFGESGAVLLVEEYMQGPEVSVLALCDTKSGFIFPLPGACDYKRIGDGDAGANTGGMGVYAPTRLMGSKMVAQVLREILMPALHGFQQQGIDYRGILYAGLMLTDAGPKVVEFNCRFGDPETQALLPLLESDLLEYLLLTAQGRLTEASSLRYSNKYSVGVVLVAEGYPGTYQKGIPITGADLHFDGVELFHAGTALNPDGQLVTNGGRVFNIISTESSISLARKKVYNAINAGLGAFVGMQYRHDIAQREEE